MPVDQVMTSPVIGVSFDMSVMDVVAITRGCKVRHIPVLNNEGKMTGVLTRLDVIEALYVMFR